MRKKLQELSKSLEVLEAEIRSTRRALQEMRLFDVTADLPEEWVTVFEQARLAVLRGDRVKISISRKREKNPIRKPSGWQPNIGGRFYTKNTRFGVKYMCKQCGAESLGTRGSDIPYHNPGCAAKQEE